MKPLPVVKTEMAVKIRTGFRDLLLIVEIYLLALGRPREMLDQEIVLHSVSPVAAYFDPPIKKKTREFNARELCPMTRV